MGSAAPDQPANHILRLSRLQIRPSVTGSAPVTHVDGLSPQLCGIIRDQQLSRRRSRWCSSEASTALHLVLFPPKLMVLQMNAGFLTSGSLNRDMSTFGPVCGSAYPLIELFYSALLLLPYGFEAQLQDLGQRRQRLQMSSICYTLKRSSTLHGSAAVRADAAASVLNLKRVFGLILHPELLPGLDKPLLYIR